MKIYAFNSLYEIPNLPGSLSEHRSLELSILFMRFLWITDVVYVCSDRPFNSLYEIPTGINVS